VQGSHHGRVKLQSKIRWIGKQLELDDDYPKKADGDMGESDLESIKSSLHFKSLESNVGFIVYVAMTYTLMIPYLKGIYLTLNLWMDNRNEEGWKEFRKRKQECNPEEEVIERENPPDWVSPVPRLKTDIKALMEFSCLEDPPDVRWFWN
jgi:hypothetical protein